MEKDVIQLKRAAYASLATLLNLTFLPVIGFIALLVMYKKVVPGQFDYYYVVIGIKLSLLAATALVLVSALMLTLGGFDSMMSWAYVVTYFMTVHAFFVLIATWMLVRAWSGHKVR
ncbi:MAG: hypothetical protein KUG50_00665 [Cycloclasticus sp.]|nr:hypothetical protein [Cycloclasticus sp.]